jgi:GNAT superfamily N-acetyltransferase
MRRCLARLSEQYVPPDGASLLALWDGEPVGWVFLHRRDQQANAIEMKHLFVLDGWRRRGIGTTLVAAVVAQAQQLGAAVLLLDVDESRRGQPAVRSVRLPADRAVQRGLAGSAVVRAASDRHVVASWRTSVGSK